ncbi:hypothetical protein PM082_024884 [Marasmius tenuissimus]|nr:hypothetical protein PM082_024884 [Marasmius tenuissimus]
MEFTKLDNEGLLWTLGARGGIKDKPKGIEEFEETGNCLSWTWQQVEAFRWMEEFEQKHAEFHQIICYFQKMKEVLRQKSCPHSDSMGQTSSYIR